MTISLELVFILLLLCLLGEFEDSAGTIVLGRNQLEVVVRVADLTYHAHFVEFLSIGLGVQDRVVDDLIRYGDRHLQSVFGESVDEADGCAGGIDEQLALLELHGHLHGGQEHRRECVG